MELKYGESDFERRNYALLGLMCIYGIELLPDNIADCRKNLLEIFASKYMLCLPTEEQLRLEVEKERRLIEAALEDGNDK